MCVVRLCRPTHRNVMELQTDGNAIKVEAIHINFCQHVYAGDKDGESEKFLGPPHLKKKEQQTNKQIETFCFVCVFIFYLIMILPRKSCLWSFQNIIDVFFTTEKCHFVSWFICAASSLVFLVLNCLKGFHWLATSNEPSHWLMQVF